MTIQDLCTIIRARLKIDMSEDGTIFVRIERAETKEGGLLRSSCGRGATLPEAIASYCTELAGKTLVVNAYTDGRREYDIPMSLSG